jgi:hypothetical protein
MPHAIRCLAVVACALVAAAGCDDAPYYSLAWSKADTVTLAPGESVALPVTVQREASSQGEARITLRNAPEGVSLTPSEFSIPEGESSVTATPTLSLVAEPSAQLQTVSEAFLVAEDPSNDFTSGARLYVALLAPPAPQPDFSLSVEPRQLDLNVGQRRQVTVTVTRAAGFTGPLTITLGSTSGLIQAQPLTLSGAQTSGTLEVSIDSRTPTVPVATRLVASAEDGRQATTGFTLNIR